MKRSRPGSLTKVIAFAAFFVIALTACDQQKEQDASSLYQASVVPENMTIEEKKERFLALLLPPTQKVYAESLKQYEDVSSWVESGKKKRKVNALKEEYRAETDAELLAALKPHPPSIALAQAAVESAWGTSRFFVEANNVFGVWSFDKDEPRVPAGRQRGEKTIWVREYESLEDSVRHYYRVLARGHAHQHFRDARFETDNPYILVKNLDQYSEKREVYVKKLISIMRFNRLTQYDPVVYEYESDEDEVQDQQEKDSTFTEQE